MRPSHSPQQRLFRHLFMNPLLDFSGLPRFAEIKTEHVTPAVTQLLAEAQAVVAAIGGDTQAVTWENFVQPMEDANERLSRAWGQVSHLNAVMNSAALREVYNKNLPKITQYFASLAQNTALFEKYKQLKNSAAYAQLSGARKKIIDNELRDFRLGGAELPADKKARFMEVQEALSALSSRFSDNVLDATNAFALVLHDASEVAGIPEDALQTARELAQLSHPLPSPLPPTRGAAPRSSDAATNATATRALRGEGVNSSALRSAESDQDETAGWKFTLHAPSYMPVMQYGENRAVREKMYRAYATRASELGDSELGDIAALDNTALIQDILKLRAEEASLLGFGSYAEVSLATKMATQPQQVIDFLQDLASKARAHAERDFQELREFAAKKLNLANLESWDLTYASEKLRLERYAFSDQEVKQYFPEPRVLSGLFGLVEKLYGIAITPAPAAAQVQYWHPDAKLFEVREVAGADGKLLGQFYLDLYARDTKRGGAWMDDAITRRRLQKTEGGKPHKHCLSGKVSPQDMLNRGQKTVKSAALRADADSHEVAPTNLSSVLCPQSSEIQIPVAYLNCNFAAPVGGKPALFTHDEVITLFHEFGHGLHHLLTEVEDLGVSGINGVEWDAVELPSQFMENFCWEWDVLADMTEHVDSGKPLPRGLFDKMVQAKNFQSGLQTLRQIEFSLFDLRLHHDFDANGDKSVSRLIDEIRQQVAVIFPPEFNRFANSFSHIFSGGYAAGYYSYKWAEVLSADAYSVFEESGTSVVNADTGARFRREILSVGGSRPALLSFKAFRGREPSIEALLRHNGMAAV